MADVWRQLAILIPCDQLGKAIVQHGWFYLAITTPVISDYREVFRQKDIGGYLWHLATGND